MTKLEFQSCSTLLFVVVIERGDVCLERGLRNPYDFISVLHLCVLYLSLDSGMRASPYTLGMDHSPGYKQTSTKYQNDFSHTRKGDCVGMPTFTKCHYNTQGWLWWKQKKRNERMCNGLCVVSSKVTFTDYLTFALASNRDTLIEKKVTNSITLGLIGRNENGFLVLSLSHWLPGDQCYLELNVTWSSIDTLYSKDYKHKFSDSGFCKGCLLGISTRQTNSPALKETDSVSAASKSVLYYQGQAFPVIAFSQSAFLSSQESKQWELRSCHQREWQ